MMNKDKEADKGDEKTATIQNEQLQTKLRNPTTQGRTRKGKSN